MPDGVVASTTVGRVTTPSAQVACVTSGAAGCTGVHVTAVRPTLNVAVVAFTSVHPSGSGFGQATPVAASVAVTVTDWAGNAGYVPGGLPDRLSASIVRSVIAGVTVCDVSTPATHAASLTVGTTGVT